MSGSARAPADPAPAAWPPSGMSGGQEQTDSKSSRFRGETHAVATSLSCEYTHCVRKINCHAIRDEPRSRLTGTAYQYDEDTRVSDKRVTEKIQRASAARNRGALAGRGISGGQTAVFGTRRRKSPDPCGWSRKGWWCEAGEDR